MSDGINDGHLYHNTANLMASKQAEPTTRMSDEERQEQTHRQKIAWVEEEIQYMSGFLKLPDGSPHPVWNRILKREQEVLADLRRGWKGKP